MRTIAAMLLFMATCVAFAFAIVASVEVFRIMSLGGCIPYELALKVLKSYGGTVVGWGLYLAVYKD